MTSNQVTVRLGWYHFVLRIPEHWEVVAYKTNPQNGELTLADRNGQVMRIFWKTHQPQPAPLRRLLQVASEHAGADATEKSVRQNVEVLDGWHAYLPREGEVHGLACRYEDVNDALIYAVFPPHPDTVERDRIRDVLRSFTPNAGPERAWAAFGIDIELPAEMDIIRVEPYPAAQLMRFENRRGESVTVHRYGMLSLLLDDQDAATYFARRTGRARLLFRQGRFRKEDRHPGIRLSYTTRGKGGIEAFMSRTWQGRVWVWQCDELERLYAVDNNAREKNLIPDLPDRVLTQ